MNMKMLAAMIVAILFRSGRLACTGETAGSIL